MSRPSAGTILKRMLEDPSTAISKLDAILSPLGSSLRDDYQAGAASLTQLADLFSGMMSATRNIALGDADTELAIKIIQRLDSWLWIATRSNDVVKVVKSAILKLDLAVSSWQQRRIQFLHTAALEQAHITQEAVQVTESLSRDVAELTDVVQIIADNVDLPVETRNAVTTKLSAIRASRLKAQGQIVDILQRAKRLVKTLEIPVMPENREVQTGTPGLALAAAAAIVFLAFKGN